MFEGGNEDDYILKGKYDNYSVVNKDLTGEDAIFVKGKIVDDFNTLDKSSIFPLNVSSTQEPRVIIEQSFIYFFRGLLIN